MVGKASARNDGIDIARGKYLSFIDADDYVAPEMLETLYELILKYDADISECGYISVFGKMRKSFVNLVKVLNLEREPFLFRKIFKR